MANNEPDPINIRCLIALLSMTREQCLECLNGAAEEANAGNREQVANWLKRLACLTAATSRWFEAT